LETLERLETFSKAGRQDLPAATYSKPNGSVLAKLLVLADCEQVATLGGHMMHQGLASGYAAWRAAKPIHSTVSRAQLASLA
jgi:hypothetical protein